MIVISTEQMTVFQEQALRRFKDDMLVHLQNFAPEHCRMLRERDLRAAIDLGVGRGLDYGFTDRGPMQLYLELQWMFGSDFDTDPQLPWVREILTRRPLLDEYDRAQCLYERTLNYLDAVCGARHVHSLRAFDTIIALAPPGVIGDLGPAPVARVLDLFVRVYPTKFDHVGSATLGAVVTSALVRAQRHGLVSSRAQIMFCLLVYIAGHGCDHDPLYPWIAQTLRERPGTSAETRAHRLEQRALTYLQGVLDNQAIGGANV